MTVDNQVVPVSLRTLEDELQYRDRKKRGESVPLIHEPKLKTWKYWAIIENKFPYSGAFKVHHLLIPKKQATYAELSKVEKDEMELILAEIAEDYDCSMVNFGKRQSKPGHYHIHLLVFKDQREELRF